MQYIPLHHIVHNFQTEYACKDFHKYQFLTFFQHTRLQYHNCMYFLNIFCRSTIIWTTITTSPIPHSNPLHSFATPQTQTFSEHISLTLHVSRHKLPQKPVPHCNPLHSFSRSQTQINITFFIRRTSIRTITSAKASSTFISITFSCRITRKQKIQ